MAMIMSSMSVSESKKAHHINEESQHAHHKQLLNVAELGALYNALDGFPNKFDANKHQEDTIAKAGESIELAPSIRFFGAGRPLRCYRRSQTDNQAQAIEKHMYCIAQQAKGAADVAIDALYNHKSEVQPAILSVSPSRGSRYMRLTL